MTRFFLGFPYKMYLGCCSGHSPLQPASNLIVTVTKISRRVLAALTVMAFMLLGDAQALPIKPDVKKLVDEAQQPPPAFIPSRVGWNGPEKAANVSARERWEAAIGPVLAAEQQRQLRNTLRDVFIPEPRAIAAIVAIIFLLRKLRSLREQQAVLAQQPQAA